MQLKKFIPLCFRNKIKNSLIYVHIRVRVLNKPIKVWFFREPDFINFGDELTTDIIERLFKRKCELVDINDADLYGVGSIIELANRERVKKSYVWGSGFISQGGRVSNTKLFFKAVRGEETKQRLSSRYRHIPVGDPGLLSSLIYTEDVQQTDRIGIIPHYVDEDNTTLDKARLSDKYLVISVKQPPEDVARLIRQCKVILSSSLHGLIVADSFSIPNKRLVLSDKLTGGDYKFNDYYSATGRKYEPFDGESIYDEEAIEKLIKSYQPVVNIQDIQKKLIESFPFK